MFHYRAFFTGVENVTPKVPQYAFSFSIEVKVVLHV